MKKALIIFVRTPELGKVKTRLAATIGDDQALKVYNFLLQHTAKVSNAAGVPIFVYYAGSICMNDLWNGPGITKKKQEGVDLGTRMSNAFSGLFASGYNKVVIIGSDCYELSTDIISRAFDLLSDHDVAIGSARDGGYYLLGMKCLWPAFFEGKIWSGPAVFTSTLEDARLASLSVALLPVLSDVDEEKDINFSFD